MKKLILTSLSTVMFLNSFALAGTSENSKQRRDRICSGDIREMTEVSEATELCNEEALNKTVAIVSLLRKQIDGLEDQIAKIEATPEYDTLKASHDKKFLIGLGTGMASLLVAIGYLSYELGFYDTTYGGPDWKDMAKSSRIAIGVSVAVAAAAIAYTGYVDYKDRKAMNVLKLNGEELKVLKATLASTNKELVRRQLIVDTLVEARQK